jgi:poly(A) polymerase
LAGQAAARFRLSRTQKKRLVLAAGRSGAPGDPRALAYRLGPDQALDRLLLTGGDTAPLREWELPAFPLRGGDIVARGIKAGPQVARLLREVEDRWIAEGFPDAARAGKLLDEQLGSA